MLLLGVYVGGLVVVEVVALFAISIVIAAS